MSSYLLEFAPAAEKELDGLPKKAMQRVLRAIHDLAENPRPRDCKKLKGADNLFRIRVGRYRVIYAIFDKTITVVIVRVRHRKDAYE